MILSKARRDCDFSDTNPATQCADGGCNGGLECELLQEQMLKGRTGCSFSHGDMQVREDGVSHSDAEDRSLYA